MQLNNQPNNKERFFVWRVYLHAVERERASQAHAIHTMATITNTASNDMDANNNNLLTLMYLVIIRKDEET